MIALDGASQKFCLHSHSMDAMVSNNNPSVGISRIPTYYHISLSHVFQYINGNSATSILALHRYCDKLKGAKIFPVAVRVVNGDEKGEWLEVGRVKSEGDEFTEVAVAMQRGLIAEHAKRLLPLQVKPKDMVEWGYRATNSDDEPSWSPVDKSVCDDAPKGMEKKIGFEGSPDPNSGFYCHYSSGRLVDKSDAAKQMAKSG